MVAITKVRREGETNRYRKIDARKEAGKQDGTCLSPHEVPFLRNILNPPVEGHSPCIGIIRGT